MSLERLRLDELFALARCRGASDLHVGGNERPTLRIDGRVIFLDEPPVPESVLIAFAADVLDPRGHDRLEAVGSADTVVRDGPAAPYRMHFYRSSRGLRLAARLLAVVLPPFEQTGLPSILTRFIDRSGGLLLVTGPTGSGKTTALASLVHIINRSDERIVLTVEDPIEYVHPPQRSSIAHCEIGRDVVDYGEALRSFLRADPDVILVGELRDGATAQSILTAAETGHLVLSTAHTNDAPQTVDRIVDAVPPAVAAQARAQLAATLIAVVSIRLVARRNARGRLPACEILVATDAVRALIRDGKTHQLRNAMSTGRASGMQTLEADLSDMVARGMIEPSAARAAANRPDELRLREPASC